MAADFRAYGLRLLALFVALALPQSLVFWRFRFYESMVNVLADTFFEVGVFFFIALFLGRWKRWAYHAFFAFALIDFALSLACFLTNGQSVNIDTFSMVMGTNSEEAKEFFTFYFPWWKMLILAASVAALWLFYAKGKRQAAQGGRTARWGVVAYMALVMLSCCVPQRELRKFCSRIIPLKYVVIARSYQPVGKLADYRHDASVVALTDKHPDRIVVIVGESFSKSHSSVYGYEHKTNPELERMAEEGNVYAFSRCVAPAPFTHLAFMHLFSLYDGNDQKGKWYERETLFDVFGQFYDIRWISNQNSHGMHDNVQAAYAALSDSVWFADVALKRGGNYDEVVLPVAEEWKSRGSGPSLTIINLMGQHESFAMRYPSGWDRFKASDYAGLPEEQRAKMAEYDNATLYNDHVVSALFDLYKDERVLAFYFPDHGLDLYDSDPTYCGHAREANPRSVEACLPIPFFVYLSDSYKEAFPEHVAMVEGAVDREFCTTSFLASLMQLAGWKFAGSDEVEHHSVFDGK